MTGGLVFDGVDDYGITKPIERPIRTIGSTFVPFSNSGTTWATPISTLQHHPVNAGFTFTVNSEKRMNITYGSLNSGRPIKTIDVAEMIFGKKINVFLVQEMTKFVVYINGKKHYEFPIDFNYVENFTCTIGRWASSLNSYYFEGKVCSSFAYNRALSEEEIAHNYQIEKERWGL